MLLNVNETTIENATHKKYIWRLRNILHWFPFILSFTFGSILIIYLKKKKKDVFYTQDCI